VRLRGGEGGFTLIEVMVVVVIMAVLSSMVAILTMPGDDVIADREARRLAALLELALAEARASGQSIAWSPEGGGYSFWRRDQDGEWVRFPGTSVYRPRSLDGQATLRRVFVDAHELAQGGRAVLSPYGGSGIIEATISCGDSQITIRGNVLGRMSLQRSSDRKADDGRSATNLRLHAG
jgi:general secretion pathway protein H